MLRLGMTVLGVADMGRAVSFWTQALGYQVHVGGASACWTELGPADAAGSPLALQHSDERAEEHPRVHLDLLVDTAEEQAREVQRLVWLGAERVDWDLYPATPDFVVLADPDGNRFCVVDASLHDV